MADMSTNTELYKTSFSGLTIDSAYARIEVLLFLPTSGPVAQLGARFHGMEEVVGSIPTRSTNSLTVIRRKHCSAVLCHLRRLEACGRRRARVQCRQFQVHPDRQVFAHQ